MKNNTINLNLFAHNMYNTINQRIEALLDLLRLRQIELANGLELQRSTLNGIIKGRQKPSFKVIEGILKKYPVNPEWLILGEGEPLINDQDKTKGFDTERLMNYMEKRISELERELLKVDPETAKKLGIK